MPARPETTSRDSPGMIPYGCSVSLLPGFYEQSGQKRFTFHSPGIQPFLPTFSAEKLDQNGTELCSFCGKACFERCHIGADRPCHPQVVRRSVPPAGGTPRSFLRKSWQKRSSAIGARAQRLRLRSSAIGSGARAQRWPCWC